MVKIGVNWWFVFDYLRSFPCQWFARSLKIRFSLIIIRFQESFLLSVAGFCGWLMKSAKRLQREKISVRFRCLLAVCLPYLRASSRVHWPDLVIIFSDFSLRESSQAANFRTPKPNPSAQIIFITNFCNHFYNVLNRVPCAPELMGGYKRTMTRRTLFRN